MLNYNTKDKLLWDVSSATYKYFQHLSLNDRITGKWTAETEAL
jgi:hypothetical protein